MWAAVGFQKTSFSAHILYHHIFITLILDICLMLDLILPALSLSDFLGNFTNPKNHILLANEICRCSSFQSLQVIELARRKLTNWERRLNERVSIQRSKEYVAFRRWKLWTLLAKRRVFLMKRYDQRERERFLQWDTVHFLFDISKNFWGQFVKENFLFGGG